MPTSTPLKAKGEKSRRKTGKVVGTWDGEEMPWKTTKLTKDPRWLWHQVQEWVLQARKEVAVELHIEHMDQFNLKFSSISKSLAALHTENMYNFAYSLFKCTIFVSYNDPRPSTNESTTLKNFWTLWSVCFVCIYITYVRTGRHHQQI